MSLFKKAWGVVKSIDKKITKGISKIPLIGKLSAKIHNKAKGLISKVWKSKLGKIVMIAAAIYFTGGLAAGSFAPSAVAGQYAAWGSQLGAAVTGTSAAGGTAGTLGATTTAGTAGGVSSGLGLSAESLAASSGSIGSIATGAGTAATAAGSAGVSTAAAGSGIGGGLLSGAKAVGTWASNNQLLAASLAKGGAKAIEVMNTPSAEENEAGKYRAQQAASQLSADFTSRLNTLNPLPAFNNNFTTVGMLRQAQNANAAPTGVPPQQTPGFVPPVYDPNQPIYPVVRPNQFATTPA